MPAFAFPAAKVASEPNLTNAALRTNVSFSNDS